MSDAWQVKSSDTIHGPFSLAQLRKLVASGRVQRETPIRPSENSIWIAAESVEGLFDNPAPLILESPLPTPLPAAGLTNPNTSPTERHSRKPNLPADVVEPVLHPGPPAPEVVEPVVAWEPPAPVKRLPRLLLREPESPWDIFDWRFEHYLTPWIIRATWLLILIATTLWIMYAIANAGYAVVFDRTLMHDLTSAQKNAAPQRPGDAPRPEIEFNPSHLGQTRLSALAWAVGSILGTGFGLLYFRVLCELLIVTFNIAGSLRRLELLSEQSRD